MKKNNMLRIASVLLVAVLLTTCAVSGAFASYYTGTDANDSAHVAKWGVDVTATAEAFSKTYDADDVDLTVKSDVEVVAPGTAGDLAALTVTGTPEVDVRVTKTANLTLTGWEANGAYYCPIVINVNGTEFKGMSFTSAGDFEKAVEAAILGSSIDEAVNSKDYTYHCEADGGVDLADADLDVEVTWAWAFGDEGSNPVNINDTALGDAAADGNAARIAIEVSISVQQIGD